MSVDPLEDDLTETQRCIIQTANRNPDMTVKQIASNCGCSASYVSQTLKDQGNPLDIDFEF